MFQRRVSRLLGVAVAGLAVVVFCSGVAQAASAQLVVSDRALFSGNGKPGPKGTPYVFSSTNCRQSSDGEGQMFPCQLDGQITPGSPTTGSATLRSADGTISWKFTLSRTSPGHFKMTGRGSETDTADPGLPPPPPYPCAVTGFFNLTSPPPNFTFSSGVTVSEGPGAP